MRNHEKVFVMNAVFYYSNTNQSKRIAEYISEKLSFPLIDIAFYKGEKMENSVLVFPVYCQNIPKAVKSFLSVLKTQALSLLATYGRASHGNVLWEIQKKYPHAIVAAGYVPTKHTYINEAPFEDFESLVSLIEKIKADKTPIVIKRAFKNPIADIFPDFRSRMLIKIGRTNACVECGVCTSVCEQKGIENGKPNSRCIRCMRCVEKCPKQALYFKKGWFLRMYLKHRKKNKLVLYL